MIHTLSTLLIVLQSLIVQAAVYDSNGEKIPDEQASSPLVSWKRLNKQNEFNLSGVGVLSLDWGLGIGNNPEVCTVTLIDTGVDTGPAYVLSNGHCNVAAGFTKPDEVGLHRKTSYHVLFNHFMDVPPGNRIQFDLAELTYLTETGTDVSIYRIAKQTLKSMRGQNIFPIPLSRTPPFVGAGVRLVGVPLYYVPISEMSLHYSECTVIKEVGLKNGDFFAPHSWAHKCNSIPGFSGGPLISLETREILLLNSHGADDSSASSPECAYEKRPCEWQPGPPPLKFVDPKLSYGQRVDTIAGCFNNLGEFDLNVPGCGLPKPKFVRARGP